MVLALFLMHGEMLLSFLSFAGLGRASQKHSAFIVIHCSFVWFWILLVPAQRNGWVSLITESIDMQIQHLRAWHNGRSIPCYCWEGIQSYWKGCWSSAATSQYWGVLNLNFIQVVASRYFVTEILNIWLTMLAFLWLRKFVNFKTSRGHFIPSFM